MRAAVAALLLAACIPTYSIDATTAKVLAASETQTIVRLPPVEAAQLVIAKLGARGFTLVALHRDERGFRLELAGNRDFSGTHTLGSMFFVWIERATDGRSQIRIIGKPTFDHRESCPAIDVGATCTKLETYTMWGLRGDEEARVVRGVFAEIALDSTTNDAVAGR